MEKDYTKMPVVLVDIDGTMVDIYENVRIRLAKKGIDFHPEGIKEYNFIGDIGCKRQDVFTVLYERETYENMPFYKDAEKALVALGMSCFVCAYTSSMNLPSIMQERKRLITNMPFDEIFYFPGREKNTVLSDADKSSMRNPRILDDAAFKVNAVFDDYPKIIRMWKDSAHCFVTKQPYNHNMPELEDGTAVCAGSFYDNVKFFLDNIDYYRYPKGAGIFAGTAAVS